eukprot:COSAG06_NODE_31059_length_527_cov_1.528037_2_plen_30_part_01
MLQDGRTAPARLPACLPDLSSYLYDWAAE